MQRSKTEKQKERKLIINYFLFSSSYGVRILLICLLWNLKFKYLSPETKGLVDHWFDLQLELTESFIYISALSAPRREGNVCRKITKVIIKL